MTRQKLAARMAEFESDKRRRILPACLGLLAVCAFGPFGLSAYLRWMSQPEPLCVGAAALSFPGVPFWAWRCDAMIKGLQATHEVVCQRCGKPLVGLTGELAMTTGRCGRCGELVISDA